MSVKDGLPSTDFSRMNREWVKAVAGGGSGGVGLPAVTEADNGKILGVVNGEWGAMDAGGGGGNSDFTEKTISLVATNTDEQHYTYFTYGIYGGVNGLTGEVNALVKSDNKWCMADTVYMDDAQVTAGTHTINLLMTSDGELQFYANSGKVLSISGDVEFVQDPYDGNYYLVTGTCTINVDLNPD